MIYKPRNEGLRALNSIHPNIHAGIMNAATKNKAHEIKFGGNSLKAIKDNIACVIETAIPYVDRVEIEFTGKVLKLSSDTVQLYCDAVGQYSYKQDD